MYVGLVLLTATDQTVDSDTHPSENTAAFLPILFQSFGRVYNSYK